MVQILHRGSELAWDGSLGNPGAHLTIVDRCNVAESKKQVNSAEDRTTRPRHPRCRILSSPFDRLEQTCYTFAHDTLPGPIPNTSPHRPSPLTAAPIHEQGSVSRPFWSRNPFFAKRNHFSRLCRVREAACTQHLRSILPQSQG